MGRNLLGGRIGDASGRLTLPMNPENRSRQFAVHSLELGVFLHAFEPHRALNACLRTSNCKLRVCRLPTFVESSVFSPQQ